jgi:hypothetical protein
MRVHPGLIATDELTEEVVVSRKHGGDEGLVALRFFPPTLCLLQAVAPEPPSAPEIESPAILTAGSRQE